MERDGHRSVLSFIPDTPYSPLHMHHIIGRHDERLETVAMVTLDEHEGPGSLHAGDLGKLRSLAAWCVAKGYIDAARHLARRIAKSENTQRLHPRKDNAS